MNAPILLDVSRPIWRQWTRRLPTGIDRVCLAYLEHFAPQARAVVQFRQFRRILGRCDSARLFDLLLEGSPQFRTKLVMTLASASLRGERSAAGQVYLNVGHTGLNSPYLGPWIKRRQLKPVYLIHDLIPITHPQFCREGEAIRHGQRIKHALASARGFIVNSTDTERELGYFAEQLGLPAPTSHVAWLGTDQMSEVQPPAPPARPYFVVVGTIEARKNHPLLLKAWAEMVATMGEEAPELMIIGQRGWKADATIEILDNLGPLKEHVRELRHCDDAELQRLVAGARALLMPSCAEGFGLPVVEALQLGTPVIASELPVFREIAGDIPEYLDPADEPGWRRAVLDYVADHGRRRDQLGRLANFCPPRWDHHFHGVEQFLGAI